MKKKNFKQGNFAEVDQQRPTEAFKPNERPGFVYNQSVLTTSTIEVKIDRQAYDNRHVQGDEAIKKFVNARKLEQKLREAHSKCAEWIENDNDVELMTFLSGNSDLMVSEIVDPNGKTLLHECTFNDSAKCTKAVLLHARSQKIVPDRIAAWINQKDSGDGFTALHFASFKGNPELCELLIEGGADIYAKNNFGINMLHVAAQGDQPISIYFFKLRGLDLRSRDNRGSTPLHWAAYSKAEITLVYLLSWVEFLDDQDCDGFTPLHLAVKSVESLKSTRPVRSLLIRGASRHVVDN